MVLPFRPLSKWNNKNVSMAASCELKVGPSWASTAASPGILRQRILLCLSFSVDSQDYNWHILILQAGKISLMKHSDGSAKHEDIMKLQQSHVVLALKSIHVEENTLLRKMHCPHSLNHCRAENHWQGFRNTNAS